MGFLNGLFSADKQSTNNTATTNQSYDQRQVTDASNGGVVGSGNSWDNSDSGNTTWDWSQVTSNNDSRQTTNSGNTTWQWTNTDGGAIKGMTDVALAQGDLAGKVAKISADNASMATAAAVKAQTDAIAANNASLAKVLEFADGVQAQAYKSNVDGIGMVYDGFSKLASMTGALVSGAQKQADSAASSVQAAYTSAASQANGNKTLTIAALAVVAVIGAALLLRKGG